MSQNVDKKIETSSMEDEQVKEIYRNKALKYKDINAVLNAGESFLAKRSNILYDRFSKMFVLETLKPVKSDRILDFGTGVGRLASFLADFTGEVVGVDNNEEMLNVARANVKPNVKYVHIENYPWPLEENSFDKVLSFWVMASISDALLGKIVPELFRLTKKGGKLMIMEQIRERPFYEGGVHKQRVRSEYIDLFTKNGFELVEDYTYMRNPSYAMSIWCRNSFLPEWTLSFLYLLEKMTRNRKPEHIQYTTHFFSFRKP